MGINGFKSKLQNTPQLLKRLNRNKSNGGFLGLTTADEGDDRPLYYGFSN
jgi:hypothetical protein